MLALAIIIIFGIGAQWLAWRIHLPSILLLLTFGFIAGPVTGLVDPDELLGDLLFDLVSLSVALILFEGGLTLKLSELRGIGFALLRLLTIGAGITWVLTAGAAYWLLDFPIGLAILFGAILIVTGPTVIGPLLRHIRPSGRVGNIAKWEGIVIDPLGAIFAVLVFQILVHAPENATVEVAWMLLSTIGVGTIIGALAAFLLILLLRRYWIPDYLQSPVVLMVVVAAFAGSNAIKEESGLLTVTLMGLLLANQKRVTVKHIIEFKESLSILLISSLFILLAARVQPQAFTDLGWQGVLFLAVMIVGIRPLSVFGSCLRSGLSLKEMTFLSWLAPRGIVAAAVASLFALHLREAHYENSDLLVPATFLVIVGTVAVYGLTASPLARFLGLASADPQGILIASAHPGARAIAHALKDVDFRVLLVDTNYGYVATARLEGLEAYHGSILSEHVIDDLDLGGIGRMLALTSNDSVNSLATLHCSELFGRNRVYQLVPQSSGKTRTETQPDLVRGRFLFAPDLTYQKLDEHFEHGAVVKKTRLTKEFDSTAFLKYYPGAIPLFLIGSRNRLTVCTSDQSPSLTPGQTVISLIPGETVKQLESAENLE